MKELNIGDIIEYNSQKLKCVQAPNDSCNQCYFDKNNIDCTNKDISKLIGMCSKGFRQDIKDVIFVKID